MNEQITSAAELDALPVGTILMDDGNWPIWRHRIFGWCAENGAREIESDLVIRDGAPLTVLYRPDQPQRVQPSREDVARLLAHENADWIHGYLGADPATGETHDHGTQCANWEPYAEDADAVLALFAQQPTVAEVKAEAWGEGHRHAWRRGPDDCVCSAWSSNECACGRYGSGELLSLADNPYREARP